jgi:hypothetical protein
MFVQRCSFSMIKYKGMIDLMKISEKNHEVKQQTIFLLYCIIQHIFVNLFDNLDYFTENEVRIMWRLSYEIERRIRICENDIFDTVLFMIVTAWHKIFFSDTCMCKYNDLFFFMTYQVCVLIVLKFYKRLKWKKFVINRFYDRFYSYKVNSNF